MRISDWSSDVCSSDLVNGSLGPLSLTAGTYYYDEDIDYTLTADILPGMYGFLVNAGICPSAAAPCFAATPRFRQPPTLSIQAHPRLGPGTFPAPAPPPPPRGLPHPPPPPPSPPHTPPPAPPP